MYRCMYICTSTYGTFVYQIVSIASTIMRWLKHLRILILIATNTSNTNTTDNINMTAEYDYHLTILIPDHPMHEVI